MRRTAAAAAAIAAAAILGIALSLHLHADDASTATAESVTMKVFRSFDPVAGSFDLQFSGTISTEAAGEYVAVMQQRCGYSFSTAVAGAQTRHGGTWETEPNFNNTISPSATYRARWKGQLSTPVSFRSKILVDLTKQGGGRFLVTVTTRDVQQDLRGRIVLLERWRAGKWSAIDRARLAPDPAGGLWASSIATFTVRERGWTVRARVPAKTAAPCFEANVSGKVVS